MELSIVQDERNDPEGRRVLPDGRRGADAKVREEEAAGD